MLEIFIGNTNIAILSGVKSNLSNEFDDQATISFTLLDKSGGQVPGQSWPTQMYNEPGGTYACTLEDDLDLSLNYKYTCHVAGIGAGGEVMDIMETAIAKIRGSDC